MVILPTLLETFDFSDNQSGDSKKTTGFFDVPDLLSNILNNSGLPVLQERSQFIVIN